MKKVFSFIAAILLSLMANSQVEVGLFAGPQATTTKYNVFNQKQKSDYKYGFQAGVQLKVPFDKNLFFAPACFYSMKGYKVVFSDFVFPPDSTAKDNNTVIHTVELAALLQYDLGQGPGHAYIKAGPSLDFHLFGKEEFTLMDGTLVSRNMKFSNGDYGHFSANLLFQFGYETASGFFFFGQYTHGLASTNNADGGPRIYHRAYGISIGKYLNRKKIVIDTGVMDK
ncbi:MAG: PorT family protein [Chitinophagaceae bacterium]|nr:PorT family protein [Chitinophagaceae bacterium]